MNKNQINFNLDTVQFCCGMFEVGNFAQGTRNMWHTPLKFKSLQDVFADFEFRLYTDLQESTAYSRNRNNSGYIILATLTENQLPEFQDYLIESGWECAAVWKNGRTNNQINQYQRFISAEEIKLFNEFDFEDVDD